MTKIQFDILSVMVLLVDLGSATFIMWRATARRATLWPSARIIYGWISFLLVFHAVIYFISLFVPDPNALIQTYLHPFVVLFILNPLLLAIIHWRGGRLI